MTVGSETAVPPTGDAGAVVSVGDGSVCGAASPRIPQAVMSKAIIVRMTTIRRMGRLRGVGFTSPRPKGTGLKP